MYAASVERLDRDERADFDDALRPKPRPVMRALPPARPALRAVPDPERTSAERIAAIKALGGKVTMGEGA